MYKVRAGYLSHEKHRVPPWINVHRTKHFVSPKCSFLWTSWHKAVLLMNKVWHSKNPASSRTDRKIHWYKYMSILVCAPIPTLPFTWSIQNSTLESLTVHDFFDNKTSLASSPCKVYCSFVQFGDTGLPCPVHLVPSDGTTPERVVIEKVVSCRSVLLRWNPYRLWMEKGFKLVIV
jgi:hypothetical protein